MDQIGRYRIVRRLGAGTFATVWLGQDDDLDIPVAVKVLAENWIDNDDVRTRFIAEARHMRRIRDSRVVRVYDIGETTDGRPYFVMDYCDAGSLSDLRTNPIAPASALRLCVDASRALDVIHRHNVIHRDVTPGNLLLDRDAAGLLSVHLADLGVAKSMLEDQQSTMTAGTPAFMAPEQASGLPMDARADVYAMACVVHAVLTGKPPFPVKTLAELTARTPDVRPAPIAQVAGTPPMLDDVLASALALDPNLRPPSAAAFADLLERVVEQMPEDEALLVTRARPREMGLPGQEPFPSVMQPPLQSPQTWPGGPQLGQPPIMQQPFGQPMGPHPLSPMTQPPPMNQPPMNQPPGQRKYAGYTSVEWLVIGVCALLLFAVTLWGTLQALGG